MRPLLGDAQAHEGDRLIHQHRQRAQAGDPIFVILDRFEAEAAREIIQKLDPLALVHRQRPEPLRIFIDRQVRLVFLQVVIQPVGG